MYGAVGAWGLAPAEIDLKQKVAIADFSFSSRNFALWGLGWLLTAHSTKKSCGYGVVKVEIATAFCGNTTLIAT